MTSIKKPLIAIASAVVLAATSFVAPANATVSAAVTVGTTDVATTAKVVSTPATPTVPSDNKVDLADTVKFVVTVAANTVVTATATDAKIVSALDSTDAPVVASAGSSTFSGNSGASGTTVTFYAFTTKTTTGSVVIATGGSSVTYYLKGIAGPGYNLAIVAPKVANLSATPTISATVTDVFGNAVTNATISSAVIRGTVGSFSYVETDKVYKATLTAPATAGDVIVESKITTTAVSGLAKPVDSVVYTVSVGDLADQVATLSAKVAELEAKLAASSKAALVNKTMYNKLANLWNKKFPKSKARTLR